MTIAEYIESTKEEAVELLQKLGRIPAPSHQEERRAAFVSAWLKRNGFENVHIDNALNVTTVIGDPASPSFSVYAAHTDIVFPDTDPLPMRRDGNLLFAPGIGDDTANLVNLLLSARYLLENKEMLTGPVLIAANSCEEGLGNLDGTKELFRNYRGRIKEYISFDGEIGYLTNQPVGSYRYKVMIHTEGGHSYSSFGNDNAIVLASDVIHDLYSIKLPEGPKTTYNVGTISGGTTINSIAQDAEFLYEYRSPDGKCLAYMEKAFKEVIGKYLAAGKDIREEILGVRPGMGEIDMEGFSKWTDENLGILKEVYDGEITVNASSTDSNIPLSLGIYANTIGTVKGEKAHTREEWVDLTSLPAGLELAIKLMTKKRLS